MKHEMLQNRILLLCIFKDKSYNENITIYIFRAFLPYRTRTKVNFSKTNDK